MQRTLAKAAFVEVLCSTAFLYESAHDCSLKYIVQSVSTGLSLRVNPVFLLASGRH